MASFRCLTIRVDLESGMTVGAGNNVADADNGVFNTNGPIILSQRSLIDEIFCKLLTAIYSEQATIDLKTNPKKPSSIVRDVNFPLPCIQHHVASAMDAAGGDPNAKAMEMIRTIMSNVPIAAKASAKPKGAARKKSSTPPKKGSSDK
jgi:hypothetical protein